MSNIIRDVEKSYDESWMRHQYIDLERSTSSIAYELGLGTNTINARLRKFDIPIRTQSQVRLMQLAGKRFGKFTVEHRGDNTKQGYAQWWCRCDCGNLRLIGQGSLVSGRRMQCKKCFYESKHNNPNLVISVYWRQLLHSAMNRGLCVGVTQEEVQELFNQQGGKCALSGQEIYFAKTSREHNSGKTTASLDRKNSKIGYTSENIQWVHKDVNRIKSTLDNETFIMFCRLVANHSRHD